MSKYVAIYVRVSSSKQEHRSQLPDLKAFADSADGPVRWYKDTASGKTMERPGWQKLEADLRAGKIAKIVCWRLDRLGRTAAGLCSLFDELQARKVDLVSIKDGLDLATPAGRLMANVVASVAQYDNEVRSERVRAGQAVAKAAGKTWGGSKAGVRKVVTPQQATVIRRMKAEGESVSTIARTIGLSRPTIYSVLADAAG